MNGFNLKSLYIIDTNLKPHNKKATEDEIQDAKILFYYPRGEDIHIRRSNCGIIEGTLGFMECFEKSESEFYIVELSNFVFISNKFDENKLVILLLQKQKEMTQEFSLNQTIAYRKHFFKLVLNNFYETLLFYHGKLSILFQIVDDNSNDIRNKPSLYNEVFSILTDFTENYFKSLLFNCFPFVEHLHYLPLSTSEYTQILLSVQRLNEKLPSIRYTSIIYKGYLLHNEIPLEYMSLLYNTFYNNIDSSSKYIYFNRPNLKMIQTMSSNEMKASQENFNINQIPLSNYKKSFDISNSNSCFLIGIEKLNITTLNIFIPTIYFRNKDEYLKMLVYYYEGIVFFFFLNDNFNVYNKISTLMKLEKWIIRYFKNDMTILEKLFFQRTLKNEQYFYLYMNSCNKSIKFSNNIINNKKNSNGELFKADYLFYCIKSNFLNKHSSLTKLKQTYIYYNFSLERRLILFFSEDEIDEEIENAKKDLFEKILMF